MHRELLEEVNFCTCDVDRSGDGICAHVSSGLCKKKELTWIMNISPVLAMGDNYPEEMPIENAVELPHAKTDIAPVPSRKSGSIALVS